MSPLKRSKSLAARMGRWSATHWKTAVFGWLAFVVASVFLGIQLGTTFIDERDANVGESRAALPGLEEHRRRVPEAAKQE